MTFELSTTAREIHVAARVAGDWRLPYAQLRVVLPRGERRRVVLDGDGVDLVAVA